MPTTNGVVFFDIGDTLAAAEFIENRLQLRVFDHIPAILDGLASDPSLLLGIISNTHRGDEDIEARTALTQDTMRTLSDADLLTQFRPELILLSSDVGLRKDSPLPFELAVGRAARVAGVLPKSCLFVGENPSERAFAEDAGMLSVADPRNVLDILRP